MTREEFSAEFNRLSGPLEKLCQAEGRVFVIGAAVAEPVGMIVSYRIGGMHCHLMEFLNFLTGVAGLNVQAVKESETHSAGLN